MTVLIIGGSYQGKKKFAIEQFGLADRVFYECGKDNVRDLDEYPAVNGLHLWIKAALEAGKSRLEVPEECLRAFSGKVICCDDITSGIVPLDPIEREWREVTGRCLCALAKRAELVIRIHCGMPQVLKGSLGEAVC